MDGVDPVVSPSSGGPDDEPLRILFLNWRDTRNPEGGGSEVYVEAVATALAAAGHSVTLFCAAHDLAPEDEVIDGVRVVRGGTKLGVYVEAARRYRRGEFGRPDIIIDVQNGIPFFSRLIDRHVPTLVLVHHVHREQWPVVYGPLRSRIGWAIESRVSPRLYRGCQYVTVSEASKRELVSIGVRAHDITVVRNGVDAVETDEARSPTPTVLVLGRLVPHKRVELAIDAVGAVRPRHADLQLRIMGDGWWRPELENYVANAGLLSVVSFDGFVDEETKQRALASAWVMLLPSLKEGWGLVVMEAAAHGVPTIAFREAGGVQESVVDGVTGLLVDTPEQMSEALERLLDDDELRDSLGRAARARSTLFGWDQTAADFAAALSSTLGRHVPVGRLDPR